MDIKSPESIDKLNAKKHEHAKAIEESRKKITEFESEIQKLQNENKPKLNERHRLSEIQGSKLACGFILLILGAIGIVILALVKLTIVGIIFGAIGAIMILCAVPYLKAGYDKNLQTELDKANSELVDFDKSVGELNHKINNLKSEIKKHEQEIKNIEQEIKDINIAIALKEKYAKVDEWIESVSTGHVGIYVSGEVKNFGYHEKPKPKKYKNSGLFDETVAKVYINDMVYCTLKNNYLGRSFEIFEVDEPGTSKLEFIIYYSIGHSEFAHPTDPKPVKFDRESKFCWFHVETCIAGDDKGTRVYGYAFDNFEDFLEATGITKDEIINKFLK